MIKRICSEPLLHFLLLAAVLFAVSAAWSTDEISAKPDTIVVSDARVNSLLMTFERTWQRPPTPAELHGLVEDYVKEEVFYREAVKMGLDQDDTLIRRRMRQKMEFLAEDFADLAEPTEDQLQAYLDDHPDSFEIDGRVTFYQVFFDPERHAESLEADVAAIKTMLESDEGADASELGDRSLLPSQVTDANSRQVANQFGAGFAESVKDLETDQWSEPIESAFGVHLVRVQSKTQGRQVALEEAREQVRQDWFAMRRHESKQEFFQGLLKKYDVVIETPDAKDQQGEVNQ